MTLRLWAVVAAIALALAASSVLIPVRYLYHHLMYLEGDEAAARRRAGQIPAVLVDWSPCEGHSKLVWVPFSNVRPPQFGLGDEYDVLETDDDQLNGHFVQWPVLIAEQASILLLGGILLVLLLHRTRRHRSMAG
jgi:hypothetical protein